MVAMMLVFVPFPEVRSRSTWITFAAETESSPDLHFNQHHAFRLRSS